MRYLIHQGFFLYKFPAGGVGWFLMAQVGELSFLSMSKHMVAPWQWLSDTSGMREPKSQTTVDCLCIC
jgi:hypothetical protein